MKKLTFFKNETHLYLTCSGISNNCYLAVKIVPDVYTVSRAWLCTWIDIVDHDRDGGGTAGAGIPYEPTSSDILHIVSELGIAQSRTVQTEVKWVSELRTSIDSALRVLAEGYL